jgi:formylglycine-generating enzyme required for sulfatase activity
MSIFPPVLKLAVVAVILAPVAARAAGLSCPSGMVAVTGGQLERGGEATRIGSFCMDRTEVTVDAYASCVEVGARRARARTL